MTDDKVVSIICIVVMIFALLAGVTGSIITGGVGHTFILLGTLFHGSFQ